MPQPPKGDGKRWDDPQTRTLKGFKSDAVLSHFGKVRPDGSFDFPEEPKWRPDVHEPWVEIDVSMIEGSLSVDQVARKVRRMPVNKSRARRDAVRYFRVVDLVNASYFVLRTPTRGIPDHVSVYADMDEVSRNCPDQERVIVFTEGHRAWWNSPERVRLEALAFEVRTRDNE